jgi:peptidoglycan/xylan/chitin deacetylase (PgdA/CDA1 family)
MRWRAVELVAPAAATLVALLHRLSGRPAGLVVLFHLVGDRQGDPHRELVAALEQGLYERQLRHLRRCYDVVPLERLPGAVAARRRGGRHPVSITFDDDEPGHALHALPGLRAENFPATFFLSGSWLDSRHEGVWWYDLQRVADAGVDLREFGAGEGGVFEVGYSIARLRPADRRAVEVRLRELAGRRPRESLSAEQAAELVSAGHSIGFHTRHHHSLPVLDDRELEEALSEGRDELEQLAGEPVTALSYPHGDADGRVTRAAREHGFTLAVTCRRTAVTPDTDPMLLGRVEIKGASLGEFAVQLVRGLLSRA